MPHLQTAQTTLLLPLQPVAVTRPWGGQRVAPRFGWSAPEGDIGEWWLLSTRPGSESPVPDGGQLVDWLDAHGAAHGLPSAEDFPLLVKFLDASEVLSLQVHPDDLVARLHGEPNGKTEAWHVLQCEPDAGVLLGTAPGVSVGELLDALDQGADDEHVRALMNRVAVRPGDTILVPAGTIHAVDSGVVLYEVQQSSEATYRLHDWGRGRELHLDLARDACLDVPPPSVVRVDPVSGCWLGLVDDPCFRMARGLCQGSLDLPWPDAPRDGDFHVLTVVAGSGSVRCGGEELALDAGASVLVRGQARLRGQLDVLVVGPGPRS